MKTIGYLNKQKERKNKLGLVVIQVRCVGNKLYSQSYRGAELYHGKNLIIKKLHNNN